jgi:hypothetical protein
MALAGELAKYIGGELVKNTGKELATKATTSTLSNLVPKIATKAGTSMANKIGNELVAGSVLGGLVPSVRSNWNNVGDIEGMLDGKFLGTNDNYFPSVFSEGALGRATYGADQPIDQRKVAGLVRAIKNNEDIAPIAGFKNNDGLIDIYDGHHRLAAYRKAGKMPRVKLFDPANRSDAYSYADEWAKNAAKQVQQYLPTKPEAGLDEYGMGTIDLRDMNTPKVQQSVDDSSITLYHGTPNKFEDFDESLPSVWFSDSDKNLKDTGLSIKGGQSMNIMKRQLPKDLKIADEDLADKLTKQQLQDRGYAGIAYTERGPNGDETYYEIFSPNKTLKKMPEVQQSLYGGGYGRLADDAKKIGSAEVSPIDPETLPGAYDKMKDYLADYKNAVPKAIGKPASKITKADLVSLLEDYGYDTEGTKWELWNTAQDMLEDQLIDELYEENGEVFARFLGDHRGGAGITKPGAFRLGSGNRANYLDSVYSDRLGIGRSHTPMADTLNKYNRYGMDTAGGDYMTNGIGINLNSWGNEGEGGVSTIAHERMHAWQDQGKSWNYDERFRDAYEELRKDLEPYFHDREQILKDHPNSSRELDYWAGENEQEARMLQSYLENEGFTKTGRKPEWGNEIKPAFDKFYKKLRKLSKAGVALPAIALMFGLSTNKDDKKLDNLE